MRDGVTNDMKPDNTTDSDEQRFKVDDAESYDSVVDYFDKYTQRFTSHMPEALLAHASVPENGRVLDVGTGTGVIALAIAERIGSRGKAVGIDLSGGMLATATAKAEQQGLGGQTEFRNMDAENLEFPDETFDAAFSLYALRHFPNPGKSVEEIFRVLKPGGSIVVAVGSRPALLSVDGVKAAVRSVGSIWRKSTGRELSACGLIDGLIEKHVPERADRDVTSFDESHHGFTGSIKSLVVSAGFEGIRSGWKGQYSIVESAEDFWLLQMTFSSTARKRLQQASEEVTRRVKEEFFSRCEGVLEKNGRLVYQTGAAIVSGVKPAQ